MKFFLPACSFAALLLAGLPAHAGAYIFRGFTGDGDSSIDSSLTYTARADFLGDGTRTVNGVDFTETGLTGTNYVLTGPDGNFTGDTNTVTGNVSALLTDFFYGPTAIGPDQGNATLTLDNLTVGQNYVTTWYNASFGNIGGRNVTITASDTNTSIVFDENFTGNSPGSASIVGNGNLLRYAFTATAPTITYTFDAVSNGDSFHHYAFSNAAETAVYSTPVITAVTLTAGDPLPFAPFTPSNSDLLQAHLLGTMSSNSNFQQEGAGGIAVLTDGVFSINGGNPGDNSPLATAENKSFITFVLDTTENTLGYDVTSIETYGGWNDSGRDRQSFTISISLVGSDAFTDFGSIAFDPGASPNPSAIRAVFPASLSGVDAVRFDFPTGQENGYTGYGEFDVIGSATVPEPATLGLAFFGGAGLLLRRRRAGD